MQANSTIEKQELRRHMWSPYPDHNLTLWATDPDKSESTKLSYLDTRKELGRKQQRRYQWWQLTRDFQLNHQTTKDGKDDDSRGKGRTTEILASHRLSLANQSICALTIPHASIEHFKDLVELRLPQNKLRTLPKSLFSMHNLEILNLENNYLNEDSLPNHLVTGWSRLRVLFLAGNMFRRVPPNLGRISRLFYLDLSGNELLSHLPVELLISKSIGTLNADRCSDTLAQAIPDTEFISLPLAYQLSGTESDFVPMLTQICTRSMYLELKPGLCKKVDCQSDASENDDSYLMRLYSDYILHRHSTGHMVIDHAFRVISERSALYKCSICEDPVFYDTFGVVRLLDDASLPFSWICCSEKCQGVALDMHIEKSQDLI